jgi:Flp pilus assembly protein TadD
MINIFNQAIRDYDMAIKLNPNDSAYYNNKGTVLYA